MAKAPTAKQIAARERFAAMAARANAGKTLKKSKGKRGPKTSEISIGKTAVGIKLALYTLVGKPGEYQGVIPALKDKKPLKALSEFIDIPAKEIVGTTLTHDVGQFDLRKPMENTLIYIGGRVAHGAANKVGMNGLLRKAYNAAGWRRFRVVV